MSPVELIDLVEQEDDLGKVFDLILSLAQVARG